jgi:hypothetical protein
VCAGWFSFRQIRGHDTKRQLLRRELASDGHHIRPELLPHRVASHDLPRDNDFKTTERTNHAQVVEYLHKGTFLIMEEPARGPRELLGLVYTELRANNRGFIGMVAVNPDRQSAGLGIQLLEAGNASAVNINAKLSRSPSSIEDLT